MDLPLFSFASRARLRTFTRSYSVHGRCNYSLWPTRRPVFSTRTKSPRQDVKLRYQLRPLGIAQQRSIFTWIRTNAAIARKESPILYPTLLIAAAISLTALIALATNEYLNVAPKFAAYPAEVEHHLRQGIYYSEIKFDPEKSFENFAEALRAAENLEMDRFSDEVLGIHIRMTAMLEKAGKAKTAVEILERTSADCLAWVSEYDRDSKQAPQQNVSIATETSNRREEDSVEQAKDRRARLFHKAIECRVKAAELYDSDYIQDGSTAIDLLSETFSLVLKESQRIANDVPLFMTKSEIAAIADQLAMMQLRIGVPQLAAPLFLYALNNLHQEETRPTCKQVLLMSNMATALASIRSSDTAAPERLVDDAKRWADKAVEVAANVNPPERDVSCDRACATATFTLAEIARIMGDTVEAKRKYKEAMTLARLSGVDDGDIVNNVSRSQLSKMDMTARKNNTP